MNRKLRAELAQYITETFGVNASDHLVDAMAADIDTKLMDNYFGDGGDWQPNFDQYTYTGWGLVELVNALKPERVLDVGCGYNSLKGKIRNLHGIDPFNEHADELVSIEQFETNVKWDVVLCLGSINFGDEDTIFAEVAKAVGVLKAGGSIFFRLNPGLMHPKDGARWIDFFEWSPEKLKDFAERLGCVIVAIEPDANRLYSHWVTR